ncbi:uncharacterized protein LOC131582832 [Poecile atricapillus]|uniref:uncharacterized protein LOC131582832 n=1 Tax=Poecile atricapillus TaxID=48891 RepID=UPI0027384D10|nr:uncharacterized protein LOC131582832 [Poecile atricapillus]XP_058702353.1 uncharacterized protein LOC131582832 [Poecile atricapillus]XP_058702354.1 uncharacterized protein LOC131582832 [Poecile atricapillus]XP_058702355.1 uncharacterized protein LOC131582832 [Poecile atricapillus]XP_058702356.1 uncharacterized protein LOC131582832 [Poecile atricapillus]XP_058702358.1 uncharacterized protein LOC131582832 [Poecile atricapillus]XP_058702359.1 uncharacterized protein LOC131582832 [Poecile atri
MGEQELLQSRCPKPWEPPATAERGQGFSQHVPTRVMWEQGFGGGRWAVLHMSTAPSVPACPCADPPASHGPSASLGIPGAPSTPRLSRVHPACPALHTDFSSLSPNPTPGCLSPAAISIYYDCFAFITRGASALAHLKSCANSLCITFPTLAGEGLHSLNIPGLGSAPATLLLPSWMICSINQDPEHFAFQMLPGKSQAGIWALGNIQEEKGFVLSLASAHGRFRGGNSSGISPRGRAPGSPAATEGVFGVSSGAGWGGMRVAVGTGPSTAALTALGGAGVPQGWVRSGCSPRTPQMAAQPLLGGLSVCGCRGAGGEGGEGSFLVITPRPSQPGSWREPGGTQLKLSMVLP